MGFSRLKDFRAGDRVRYSDKCFSHVRGKFATVVGFDENGNIWTQPDGKNGCHSTRADYATRHLIKVIDEIDEPE